MRRIITNLLLIMGIILILYPLIGKFISQLSQEIIISNYKKEIYSMPERKKRGIKKSL